MYSHGLGSAIPTVRSCRRESHRLLTVVTNYGGYGPQRIFMDLPFDDVKIVRGYDPFKIGTMAAYRLGLGQSTLVRNLWWDWGQHRLVHLRNGISLGRSPWISSFEDFLPRWAVNSDRWIGASFARIATSPCRAIVAECDAARRRQLFMVERHAPEYLEAVAQKLRMHLPSQRLLVHTYEEKPRDADGRLRFILVGHDFFQKGGLETLRVFDRFLKWGAPLQLTIVSRMNVGDFATRSTPADLAEAKGLIATNPQAIEHFEILPYERVLDLFRRSHVGILLTYSDTFGYSVLEAQAAGCPVITTDINALPEINDDDHGWLVPVPHHAWKVHADIDTAEGRQRVSTAIAAGLSRALEDILASPDTVRIKGIRCLARIRTKHDPHAAARWMESLYHEVI